MILGDLQVITHHDICISSQPLYVLVIIFIAFDFPFQVFKHIGFFRCPSDFQPAKNTQSHRYIYIYILRMSSPLTPLFSLPPLHHDGSSAHPPLRVQSGTAGRWPHEGTLSEWSHKILGSFTHLLYWGTPSLFPKFFPGFL